MDDVLIEVDWPERRKLTIVSRLDQRISDALRRAGVAINTRCGQRGLCEGCMVELQAGSVVHISSGETLQTGGNPQMIRACNYRPHSERITLRVPPRSMLAYQPQAVSDFRLNIARAHAPLVEPPPGDRPAVAAAIDVGTTTVAVLLVDLRNGRVLARRVGFNQQMRFGDDVLTRIMLCGPERNILRELQEAVANQTIAPLLQQAIAQAGLTAQSLCGACVAGNTTMLHLLAGVDPTPLGTAPFTPVFKDHRVLRSAQLFATRRQWGWPAEIPFHLLPSASGYIGSDITAGVLASGLLYDDGPSLLVDAGTNGEIVLKTEGRLIGCATAAGPAFEGAGLSCGMRAGDGAISVVRLDAARATVDADWIGRPHALPVGFCGSAYVDFLTEARHAGLLSATGRFRDDAPPLLRQRIKPASSGDRSFEVRGGIGITESDIARLLQAKAAIAAGILTLLERNALAAHDLKRLYLAGGFGTKLSVRHAIGCGLLPGFAPEQVQVIGNSALGGAYVALIDRSLLSEMISLAGHIEVVELNEDPNFEMRYIEQLAIGEPV